MWYTSEMLGQLQKNGFLFEQDLSRGWGVLSQPELATLKTIARAKMALMALQKERAEKPQRPVLEPVQAMAAKQEADSQNAYFARLGKKLDLDNARWLKPVD